MITICRGIQEILTYDTIRKYKRIFDVTNSLLRKVNFSDTFEFGAMKSKTIQKTGTGNAVAKAMMLARRP
jgi:hypothetical protein